MASEDTELNNVTKLKNSDSFQLWDFEIQILCKAKQVWEVVSGAKLLGECGSDEHKQKTWHTEDAKAQYYIVRTIDKMVKNHILTCGTSKEMYDTLKAIYRRDTTQLKQQLLMDFHGFKFDKTKDMMMNISNLQNIVYKLKQFKQDISDEMVMAKIIYSLPEQYRYFSSAWESTPTSDKIIENLVARLCVEEEYKSASNKEEPNAAFVALKKTSNPNSKNSKPKTNIVCYKCGEVGHIKSKCLKKKYCKSCQKDNHNDYECFKNKNQNKQFPPCSYCKKTNHSSENCYFKEEHERKKRVAFFAEMDQCAYQSNIKEENPSYLSEVFDKKLKDNTFVVDSGCTSHMTNSQEELTNTKCSSGVQIFSAKIGETMTAKLSGNIETDNVILKNVSYVPELTRNLLSVNAITENDGEVRFKNTEVLILKDDKIVLQGHKTDNGLFVVDMSRQHEEESLFTQHDEEYMKWHRRLGHISFVNLKKLPILCTGIPLDLMKRKTNPVCETCIVAKLTRNPFDTIRQRAQRPLEIIHTDLCGKINPPTFDKKNYFMVFVDDYTHFVQVYLLETKDEAEKFLREYIAESENFHNLKVSKIRMDNGGEYRSNDFKEWCKQKGIQLDYSIPHSPQLNGTAERMNYTLANKMRALLADANFPGEMWGTAVQTAAYLQNRCPTVAVDTTPAEKWYKKKPDLSLLQIYGSMVYTKNLGPLKKLDPRAKRGRFVGYSNNGFIIWDEDTRQLYVSRDVKALDTKESKTQPLNRQWVEIENFFKDEEIHENEENQANQETSSEVEDNDSEKSVLSDDESIPNPLLNQRPQRERKMPDRYKDYVMMAMIAEDSLLTYEDCMNSQDKNKWISAIEEEKDCLIKNHTWDLVDEKCAIGKEIVTSRWLFKVKEDGRYKARLVARGCQQKVGLDYEYIYSSVVQTNSLRMLLAIAASENLKISTFDIKSAFLYGHLEEEIYMHLPNDFDVNGKICRLRKSLYGLKQAPHQWFKRLTEFLKSESLVQLQTDQCVFKSTTSNNKLFIAIHVDDGIIIGEDSIHVQKLLKKMSMNFETKVNHLPSTYLGIQICQNQDGVFMNQARYADQVINKYNMKTAKSVKTPIANQENYNTEETFVTKFPYQETVGSLLYLSTKTRPDISFAVSYASRYTRQPTKQDVVNIKRTLRYIKGSIEDGIHYSNNNTHTLDVYCDSDHGGDRKDKKSTTGYVLYYANGPIAWCSRKQSVVAQSSTEAEYIAAAQCCKETKYVKSVLEELLSKKINVNFHVDNQSCIKMVKAGQLTRKCIYIDVKYHFIKDEYKKGWFKILYCPTNQNVADILTKPLQPIKYETLKNMLIH